MIVLNNHLRIFLVLEPCDMRKSFNGLAALAERMKPGALKDGGLFLFTNKRRNRFKALYYDHTGICVLAKRLEVGTFSWPAPSEPEQQELNLTPQALQLIFDVVDLRHGTLRPWHEQEK